MSVAQQLEEPIVGQAVSWKNRGRYHSGIVRAIVEPGEDVLRKFPDLLFTPEARAQFQNVSGVQRVLVEEPRDGQWQEGIISEILCSADRAGLRGEEEVSIGDSNVVFLDKGDGVDSRPMGQQIKSPAEPQKKYTFRHVPEKALRIVELACR